MQQLLWSFKNYIIGDITLVKLGDEYHLFAEMSDASWDGDMSDPTGGPRYVGHAVSSDLYTWKELPIAITCGPKGDFDCHMIYHMDVMIEDGKWFMFYTGLDKHGPGQKQAVGLATSPDGISWTKHSRDPVLTADPRWYEQALPLEATYQPKDAGRQAFRDPCIIRDDASGEYGMIVIARDIQQPLDNRGCLSGATSSDLTHWTAGPPIFSPGDYHTIETPSIFKRGDRHYIIYFTGRHWGTPFDSGDPWQHAGMYYAMSEQGWRGPYDRFGKGTLSVNAGRYPRLGAARCLALSDDPQPAMVFYGWLNLASEDDDGPASFNPLKAVPPPRNVRFENDGRMTIVYRPQIEQFTREPDAALMELTPDDPAKWTNISSQTPHVWSCKTFLGTAAMLTGGQWGDGILSVEIDFHVGDRAGLILRSTANTPGKAMNAPGLLVAFDRRLERIELITADTGKLIDAHHWSRCDHVQLRVVAIGPSIEVYADDQLVIHQARHREASGALGLFVDHAQVNFSNWRVRQSST